MTHNKTLITALFLAASASFLSMPASAQPNGCMDGGRMGDRMQSMRADHMKQRQQQLHDALKLSAEQEKGWASRCWITPANIRNAWRSTSLP